MLVNFYTKYYHMVFMVCQYYWLLIYFNMFEFTHLFSHIPKEGIAFTFFLSHIHPHSHLIS